jgi:putative DNA primase/helicase
MSARYADVAADLLDKGWYPLPLPARRKSSPPIGYTGRNGRPVTVAEVAEWADAYPVIDKTTGEVQQVASVNVALRMPHTVVGIDVDAYGKKAGAERLAQLVAKFGPLPSTWSSTSRGPGPSRISFYRIPEGVEFDGEVPGGSIEFIQAHHRYAVVAPSVHPDTGRPYCWFDPDDEPTLEPPAVDDLPDLPARWIEGLAKLDGSSHTGGQDQQGRSTRQGEPTRAVLAVVGEFYSNAAGGRHPAMLKAVLALHRLAHQGHAGTADALAQIRSAFVAMVTTGTENRRTIAQAEAEFDDAVRGAPAKIAEQADKRPHYGDLTADVFSGGSTSEDGGATEHTTDTPGRPASWTDAHVGETFGSTLVGRWLYCRQLGGWLEWDGRRWRRDPGEKVFELCRRWVVGTGRKAFGSADPAELRALMKYRDRGRIDAVVTIARRLEGIEAEAAEFDAHPYLLNALNGVVDLRTGELSPHDPALRLTKLAGANYRPDATHPDWSAALAAVTDDVADWLGEAFGSAAIGKVVDDALLVFDGTGANGKTTLLKAQAMALGEYATPASPRLLMARGVSDEHPTLLADLHGRRLVYIEETAEGGRLRMEQVKAITGGGALKARLIGKDYFEFAPTHTLILATNHRPAVNASDYAAWRRLRLVPFRKTYKPADKVGPGDLPADPGLRQRIEFEPQREAALAWLVAGAVRWHRRGSFRSCAEVEQATEAWRLAEDVIAAWWSESVMVMSDTERALTPSAGARAGDLFDSYRTWCEAQGRHYLSNKEFAKRLTDHDYYRQHAIEKRQSNAGAVYCGLRVVDVVGTSVVSQSESHEETSGPATTSTTSRDDASGALTETGPDDDWFGVPGATTRVDAEW